MKRIRHLERRETLAYWPALEEQTGDSVGLVTNLNEEGISIHSHHQFEQGHRLNIRVGVDPELTGRPFIHLHVENAWCHPSGIEGIYHAGFKLINLSEEARDGIQKLLTSFSYPAPSPPQG
ncbi:MAG: hypothetical protein WCS52_11970 [bacterium]|jgi:hypothetical protein